MNPNDDMTPSWLLTADRRSARLLACTRTAHGRLHIEEESKLDEDWVELEHGRPSPRSGGNPHGNASEGHEDDERVHRFAKEVAQWLEKEIQGRGIESVDCFCAPRILGPLRSALPARIRDRIVDHATNLAHLSTGELASHRTVAGVVNPPKTPR